MRFDCQREDNEKSQRTARPLGLFYWGKVWTLAAWCELRDSFRHFRLDRMSNVASLKECYETVAGRTLQDFLEGGEQCQRWGINLSPFSIFWDHTCTMYFGTLTDQRRDLAKSPELWQFGLLSAGNFSDFVKARGVEVFSSETVTNLWRLGLLRADVVTSTSRIDVPSVELVSEDNDQFTYCDLRPIAFRPEGYGGAFASLSSTYNVDGIKLSFHPFRLYVMYHVHRVFRSHVASIQYLLNPDGVSRLEKAHVESLDRWTSTSDFAECFERWNSIAELAIVLEPTAYSAIFHEMRWRIPGSRQSLEQGLQSRREKNKVFLLGFTTEQIDEIRAALCRDAELMDDNKLVHVLLRLMSTQERKKLRSALGGCMLLICMAETIRRAAEDALGQNLREEDEMGFGQWFDGARKRIYGSDRVLDSPRVVRRDFLARMSLDYGVKVRCYVEGETEFGALTSAVGDVDGIELINLRGQVVERRGKGLSFVDSLQNDLRSHVFSVVVIDQDREDFVRVVKNAARDGKLFGRFFISSPDFEYANFTVDELVDAALETVELADRQVVTRNDLVRTVKGTTTNKELIEVLTKNGLPEFRKNESWGISLMKRALQRVDFPRGHSRSGEMRPVVEVAQLLMRARDAAYLGSLAEFSVDPNTGELREK